MSDELSRKLKLIEQYQQMIGIEVKRWLEAPSFSAVENFSDRFTEVQRMYQAMNGFKQDAEQLSRPGGFERVIHCSPAARAVLHRAGMTAKQLVDRHAAGDWGLVTGGEQKARNEKAISTGEGIVLGIYEIPESSGLWLMWSAAAPVYSIYLPDIDTPDRYFMDDQGGEKST